MKTNLYLKRLWPFILPAFVVACGGSSDTNPVSGGRVGTGNNPVTTGPLQTSTTTVTTGGTTTVINIPAALAGNLTGLNYQAGDTTITTDDTLTVTIAGLDSGVNSPTFTRNVALDVPGYVAFSQQADSLSRLFVGVVAQSEDGNLRAGVVGDGGQSTTFFAGGFYERSGGSTVPTSGLVRYAGIYAGITNLADLDQDQRLANTTGAPASALPSQPRQTTGRVFINVDFSEGKLDGQILDRAFTDGEALPTVNLFEGTVDSDGLISGSGRFADTALTSAGTYAGALSNNAVNLAGVVHLETIYLPTDPRDGTFDTEVGVFVLPQCGSASATADLCP